MELPTRDKETMKNLAAVLTTALDATPGTRYTCGHLYAQTVLISNVMPAVSVYGHTLTSNQPPRVLDLHTANHYSSLLKREFPPGPITTEEFGGSLADWRVVREEAKDAA